MVSCFPLLSLPPSLGLLLPTALQECLWWELKVTGVSVQQSHGLDQKDKWKAWGHMTQIRAGSLGVLWFPELCPRSKRCFSLPLVEKTVPGGKGRVTTLDCVCASLGLHRIPLHWTQLERRDLDADTVRNDALGDFPNSNVNKWEFNFLPLNKRNIETGNPVMLQWVPNAVRGPESFLFSIIHGLSWLLPLSLQTRSPRRGRSRRVVAEPASFAGAFLEISSNNLPFNLTDCVTWPPWEGCKGGWEILYKGAINVPS